jgi:hypothetical protein
MKTTTLKVPNLFQDLTRQVTMSRLQYYGDGGVELRSISVNIGQYRYGHAPLQGVIDTVRQGQTGNFCRSKARGLAGGKEAVATKAVQKVQ